MTLRVVSSKSNPSIRDLDIADIRGRLMFGEAQAEDIAEQYCITEEDVWRLVDQSMDRPQLEFRVVA